MLSLEQTQLAMMQALDLGPDHVPDGLFAGGRMAGLRGLKVHANTISHARLVALEETFPRTLSRIGHTRFNEHSRRFLDWPGVTALPLARIGQGFSDFLSASGEPRGVVDLAAFEWAWLECYHAAEARPLALGDLAGIDEVALLNIRVARHPAARILQLDRKVHHIIGAEVPNLRDASAFVLARPDAQVIVAPATATMAELFRQLHAPIRICNLLTDASEPERKDQAQPDDRLPALISLIEAGALVRVE
jgi:hypothetical protein